MINPNDFKMRASMAGILLGRDGVKAKIVQTYLEDWIKTQIYGDSKEFTSKYTDKGNELEDKAIDFMISALDLPFTLKNEESFEDEFFTGTPDVRFQNETYDTKCSWDSFTFPLFETMEDKIKSNGEPYADFRNYYCQGQVYMHFTGAKKHTVIYCLMSTEGKYDHLDPTLRVRLFTFDFDSDMIELLQKRVVECRNEVKIKLETLNVRIK